jgi:hypothetical protein
MQGVMLLKMSYFRCLNVILGYFSFTIGYNFSNDFHLVCLMKDINEVSFLFI